MAVYVIVGLVVVVILVLAYRALGGAVAQQADSGGLMRGAARGARDAAARLDEVYPATQEIGEPAGTVPAAAARAVRRQLEGCAQLLERVDTQALDASELAEHALLAWAVEDLTWVARLRDASAHAANEGLRAAAETLRAHAERCLREAAPTFAASAGAKGFDGTA